MSIRIGTNIESLSAQRFVSSNSQAQSDSLEKLASGHRINRSADDAAGLAISDKMHSQVRSIRQNIRNAQDGVSILQTAEGGMQEISNILVRFRELSIQASSDTVSDNERGFIDKEFQQMGSEVDRITQATEFNGKFRLLDGKGGTIEFHIGINNTEHDKFAIDQSQTDATRSSLGISDLNVRSRDNAQTNLDRLDGAIKTISERRSNLGAMQNRLQSMISSATNYHENLTGARSRILDTDLASQTADLTRSNIMQQASMSVLSQANTNPQAALRLLT